MSLISPQSTDRKPTADLINHPPHYTGNEIEPIMVIEDWKLGYHEGNVIKYLCRWRKKNGIEDLKKARWYLDRLIAFHE